MDEIATWLSPLLLLPGVGMIIMSTSQRYAQIHGELHHLFEHPEKEGRGDVSTIAAGLFARSRLFRNALVALYGSVSCLATGGLLGGVAATWSVHINSAVMLLTLTGLLLLVFASGTLIRESRRSLDIVEAHIERLK